MSPYETVSAAIKAVLPDGWQFLAYEAPNEGAPDTTSVTLKIRGVNRLPAAPIGSLLIDWVLTITTEYPDREVADPELFNDLLEFLAALDEIEPWLAWTTAEKALNEAGRLAYDITLQTQTKKE